MRISIHRRMIGYELYNKCRWLFFVLFNDDVSIFNVHVKDFW